VCVCVCCTWREGPLDIQRQSIWLLRTLPAFNSTRNWRRRRRREKEEKGTRENSYPSSFRANLLGHVGLYIHTHTRRLYKPRRNSLSLAGTFFLFNSFLFWFSLRIDAVVARISFDADPPPPRKGYSRSRDGRRLLLCTVYFTIKKLLLLRV
jgi:hypothetical protein